MIREATERTFQFWQDEDKFEKAVHFDSENAGEHDDDNLVREFAGHGDKFEDVSASVEKVEQVWMACDVWS